jgi:hypothetical protein
VRKARSRPQGQLQTGLHVEEGDRSVRELLTDDAPGGEAEAVAIERERPLEIVDAERDETDARLHVCVRPPAGIGAYARRPLAGVADGPAGTGVAETARMLKLIGAYALAKLLGYGIGGAIIIYLLLSLVS